MYTYTHPIGSNKIKRTDLTEGYYMEDGGYLIQIYDNNELIDALEANKLFHFDGSSVSIVNNAEMIENPRFMSDI